MTAQALNPTPQTQNQNPTSLKPQKELNPAEEADLEHHGGANRSDQGTLHEKVLGVLRRTGLGL